MLDPVHLTTFVTVARTLSFTRAAEELGLRQSTVSQHVRKLELAVGRPLFARDTHSVRLVSDGEVLMGFARTILGAGQRAMLHFAGPSPAGVVRFGLAEELADSGVPATVAAFADRHPSVRVELTILPGDRLAELAGSLDLVLAERRAGSPLPGPVWRDRLVWVGRRADRAAWDGPLPLVLPSYQPTAAARAVTALRGTRPWRTVVTSGCPAGLWAAVRAGLGIAPHPLGPMPADLCDVTGPLGLPALGEVEFVLSTVTRSAAVAALAETITACSRADCPGTRRCQ